MLQVQFDHVRIESFRSFSGSSRLHFGRRRIGFFMIRGSNGTGKSTLIDSVCWCLFGKTTSGQRGNSICCWSQDGGTMVTVGLYINGINYEVKRTQKPNSLSLRKRLKRDRGRWRAIGQKDLEHKLQMTFEDYVSTVALGQFGSTFFDLTPSKKLDAFSDLLGLERWAAASESARGASKARDAEIVDLARVYSNAKGALDASRAHRERLVALRESHAGGLTKERTELEDKIDESSKECVDLRRRESKMRSKLSVMADKHETQLRRLAVIGKLQQNCDGDLNRFTSLQARLSFAVGVTSNEVKRIDQASDVCTACGQRISKAKLRRQRSRAVRILESRKRKLAAARDRMHDMEKTKDGLVRIAGRLDRREVATQQRITKMTREVQSLASRSRDARDRVASYKSQLTALETAAKRFDEEIEGLDISIADLRRDMRRHKKAKFIARRKQGLADFWIDEFKALRLWVVEQALAELEAYVNNACDQLGLVGWRVSFQVERETASKTVSRGFNVLVQSPGSPELVPWEGWSGGERQRLRLAGWFGFSELVRSRRALRVNLEFLDEPTQHLNQEGIDALLQLLATRARSQRSQIWLIDHRSLNAPFDGVLCINKTKHGSELGPLV